MKPVCEIVVQEILPSVRAMVAIRLTKTYGLSQEQAARRMGTTQPAISQYRREIRGYKSSVFRKNPELMEMLEGLAKKIASGEMLPQDITPEFCRICMHIRSEGLLCELHKEANPILKDCNACAKG